MKLKDKVAIVTGGVSDITRSELDHFFLIKYKKMLYDK